MLIIIITYDLKDIDVILKYGFKVLLKIAKILDTQTNSLVLKFINLNIFSKEQLL